MTYPESPALIVTRPGWFRDALQAITRAALRLDYVEQADDGPSALDFIVLHRPVLVVLDADLLGDETWPLLQQIKARPFETPCVVLINDAQQKQMAGACKADAVLTKGFMPVIFLEAIQRVHHQKMNIPES